MTNPSGCGCSNTTQPLLNANIRATQLTETPVTECPTTVHETVCVQAEVTITPNVVVGKVQSFCVGNPIIGRCPGTPSTTGTCTFNVSQNICVQVPLTFSATAEARPDGIVCGTPATGPCPGVTACTHTIGFYRNHPEITNALIESTPTDSIVLGIDSMGLSFTVTTANANDVLNFNVPSPPAPSSPPLAQQYQVLYAQLLTAQLNLLSGATCPFATNAINNANTFLATSPAGGTTGAPAVQDPLAQFNEGNAPGCPMHCGDDV